MAWHASLAATGSPCINDPLCNTKKLPKEDCTGPLGSRFHDFVREQCPAMCGLCVVPAGADDAAPGKSNGGDDKEGIGMGLIIVVVAVVVLCAGLSIGAVLYCRDTDAEQAWGL